MSLSLTVVCVSCYKLHNIKLAENMTLLQGQRPEESNQQEEEPYRLAKRMAAISLTTVTSTPAATPPRPKANAFTSDWTLGSRSGTDNQSSGDDEAAESISELAMSTFTDAIEKLNPLATGGGRVSPLTFQLKSTWEEAKEHEKEICIDKATEACTLVCDVIAPKAGKKLFQFSSINTAGIECSSCSSDSSIPLTSPGDTSPLSPLRTRWDRRDLNLSDYFFTSEA
ncbi:hypothetical protein AWC38_SpisGene8914 [Stylophora pistillata]|uniref:Uncharacterized protein n=1 Tax=Stylophora pistillata TaxID=50429 RepID=A0A2B4SCZ8_STYPI|nr:hypothetical protein AWC38_SpisGene8914 [Stylophora pistillata]